MDNKVQYSKQVGSTFLWSFMALVLLGGAWVFTGCSKSSSGDTGTAAPTNCPSGYVATPSGCIASSGSTPIVSRLSSTIGFYAQTNNAYVLSSTINQSTFSVNSNYKNLLRDAMGVCDRNHIDWGATDCSAWLNGLQDLVIQFSTLGASTATATFRSYPYQSAYYNYYLSTVSPKEFLLGLIGFPVGNNTGIFNPMVLEMKVWPTNDSKGFALWGQLPSWSYAWNKMIKITVNEGKIENSILNFTLSMEETQIGSGTFVRCVTDGCGVPTY